MTEQEVIDTARLEARSFIEKDLCNKYPQELSRWMQNAFITNQGTIAALRHRNKELRDMVLGWDEVGFRPRRLTVEEAQMLHCCRICKGAYSGGNWLLNYGEEFAHQTCVDKEKMTLDARRV